MDRDNDILVSLKTAEEIYKDVAIMKHDIIVSLYKVEQEAKLLLERIPAYREDALKVKTMEDAVAFNKTHDLEEGLKHIRIF